MLRTSKTPHLDLAPEDTMHFTKNDYIWGIRANWGDNSLGTYVAESNMYRLPPSSSNHPHGTRHATESVDYRGTYWPESVLEALYRLSCLEQTRLNGRIVSENLAQAVRLRQRQPNETSFLLAVDVDAINYSMRHRVPVKTAIQKIPRTDQADTDAATTQTAAREFHLCDISTAPQSRPADDPPNTSPSEPRHGTELGCPVYPTFPVHDDDDAETLPQSPPPQQAGEGGQVLLRPIPPSNIVCGSLYASTDYPTRALTPTSGPGGQGPLRATMDAIINSRATLVKGFFNLSDSYNSPYQSIPECENQDVPHGLPSDSSIKRNGWTIAGSSTIDPCPSNPQPSNEEHLAINPVQSPTAVDNFADKPAAAQNVERSPEKSMSVAPAPVPQPDDARPGYCNGKYYHGPYGHLSEDLYISSSGSQICGFVEDPNTMQQCGHVGHGASRGKSKNETITALRQHIVAVHGRPVSGATSKNTREEVAEASIFLWQYFRPGGAFENTEFRVTAHEDKRLSVRDRHWAWVGKADRVFQDLALLQPLQISPPQIEGTPSLSEEGETEGQDQGNLQSFNPLETAIQSVAGTASVPRPDPSMLQADEPHAPSDQQPLPTIPAREQTTTVPAIKQEANPSGPPYHIPRTNIRLRAPTIPEDSYRARQKQIDKRKKALRIRQEQARSRQAEEKSRQEQLRLELEELEGDDFEIMDVDVDGVEAGALARSSETQTSFTAVKIELDTRVEMRGRTLEDCIELD
ncbi:hypothetical protein BCR34DRAFT_601724 [Clohesyomyces aquaticus]|uniref:Uncharacterized protein n=1 Tax=Clohesyomyces aquaticus TaxID=1231657 RepID=A0A1Y1ZL87_9PLEO|nr:hypothetical protein BCR34DRAFT_601724 [Clohesyomyces aquaticus]